MSGRAKFQPARALAAAWVWCRVERSRRWSFLLPPIPSTTYPQDQVAAGPPRTGVQGHRGALDERRVNHAPADPAEALYVPGLWR